MRELPRKAETELFLAAFELLRSKGSHRIYGSGLRVTAPFHSGAILHPKIIKQVLAYRIAHHNTPVIS